MTLYTSNYTSSVLLNFFCNTPSFPRIFTYPTFCILIPPHTLILCFFEKIFLIPITYTIHRTLSAPQIIQHAPCFLIVFFLSLSYFTHIPYYLILLFTPKYHNFSLPILWLNENTHQTPFLNIFHTMTLLIIEKPLSQSSIHYFITPHIPSIIKNGF